METGSIHSAALAKVKKRDREAIQLPHPHTQAKPHTGAPRKDMSTNLYRPDAPKRGGRISQPARKSATGTINQQILQVRFSRRASRRAARINQDAYGRSKIHWNRQSNSTGGPSRGPKLPRSAEATTLSLPKTVGGTRHEYEQVPLHPCSKEPEATCLAPLNTLNRCGGPILVSDW